MIIHIVIVMVHFIPFYSKYIISTHGTIITGDLNVVENDNLHLLMNYGTKFRIEFKYTVNLVLKQFSLDLDLFIYKI